jgi:hypothetical protein
VFVLAPARSYSTVSLALLGGHPGIYAFPEMLIFSAATVGGLLRPGRPASQLPPGWAEFRLSGVLRAVADLHDGRQDAGTVEAARCWLAGRSGWSTVELMNHLLARASPRIGVEKSPDTVSADATLQRCLAAFPSARYIHLTRHPITAQRSMHAHWAGTPGQPREELIKSSAAAWYLDHARIVRALAGLPPGRWLRIRAEDLLGRPRAWLPRVLAWLALESSGEIVSQMLHTENWRFAGKGPAGALLGGDPGFLSSPSLRAVPEPGPVAFDPAWGLSASACARIAGLAEYLGY